jgi:hypothetical protein
MILREHPEWPGATHRDDLLYIGYWRSDEMRKKVRERLPDPADFIDEGWEGWQRDAVVAYLSYRHTALYSFSGSSTCRLCGKRPIRREEVDGVLQSICSTDGTFAWPGGFLHYVRDHHVRPDERFVQHVLGHVRT